MWAISILESDELYYLKGPIVTVGRNSQKTNLAFPSDKSVSRNHAIFTLEKENDENSLYIQDLDSKFGTCIFKRHDGGVSSQGHFDTIDAKTKYAIKTGDIIRFGTTSSSIMLSYQRLSVCITRLDRKEKELLLSYTKILNSNIVNKVEDATHIVANKFAATVKMITAITLQRHIVRYDWFSFAITTGTTGTETLVRIPDMARYSPLTGINIEASQTLSQYVPEGIADVSISRQALLSDCIIVMVEGTNIEYKPVLVGCGSQHVIVQADFASTDDLTQQIIAAFKEYTLTNPTSAHSLCLFYDEELKSKLDSNTFLQQLPSIYTTIYNTLHPDHTVAGKAPLAVTWLSSSKLAIAVMQAKRPVFSPIPPVTTLPRITYPTLVVVDDKNENIDEGNAAITHASDIKVPLEKPSEAPIDLHKDVTAIPNLSDQPATGSRSDNRSASAITNTAPLPPAQQEQPPSALHQHPLPVINTHAITTVKVTDPPPIDPLPVPITATGAQNRQPDPNIMVATTSAISSSSAHHSVPNTDDQMNDHDNDLYDAYQHDEQTHSSSNHNSNNVGNDGWLHVADEESRHARHDESHTSTKQRSRTNKALKGKQRLVAADDDEGHNYDRDDTMELPLHPADTVYAEIKLKPLITAVSSTRVGSGPKSSTAGQSASQLIDRKRFQKNYVRSLDNHNHTGRGQNYDAHPTLTRAPASDRRNAITTATASTTALITGSAAVRKRGVDKVVLDELAEEEEEEEVRVASKRRRRNG